MSVIRYIRTQQKNRIAVVFTGGTIGSTEKNGRVGTDRATSSLLLRLFREKYGDEISFDALFPVSMLSENVQIADLETLCACLRGIDESAYDGVIVAHGTDTLDFTAVYLSLLFAESQIPIVLVSSAYPLADPRANGLKNFAGAVAFIRTGYAGVFVSYANEGEPCKIHLASRLLPASEWDGTFASLGEPFAKVPNGKAEIGGAWTDFPFQSRRACPYSTLSDRVVSLRSRALTDYSYFRFSEKKPAAVVLQPYHSGTVCTKGEGQNVLRFLEYCKEREIPVVLAPVDSAANVYESADGLDDLAILAKDVSFEVALVKTMLAAAAGTDVRRLLEENYFFEKLRKERGK